MRNIFLFILLFLSFISNAQVDYKSYIKNFDLKESLQKHLKFSTIYAAVNGGTSLSDVKTFSVTSGQLQEGITPTPYDLSIYLKWIMLDSKG